jgi:hypothetical protein
MNIYVVLEGEKAASKLYTSWIQSLNKALHPINYLYEFSQNNFLIIAGYGQPGFWGIVEAAVEDVNKTEVIDRLVIGVDSEDKNLEEKLVEAREHVEKNKCRVDVRYVIQHFCLETWLLGNIQLFRKKPQEEDLKRYVAFFNIRVNDPELLTAYVNNSWNRAQFSYEYLRAGIRDKYGNWRDEWGNRAFYNKHNPGLAGTEAFFYQVKKRYIEKKHIKSFSTFITAFSN